MPVQWLMGHERRLGQPFASGARLTAAVLAVMLALFTCLPVFSVQVALAEESDDVAEGSVDEDSVDKGSVEEGSVDEDNLVDPTQRADNSFIYDTTIESLFDQASLYDGRTVQVVGEVIGDCITAGDGNCWITLTSTDTENKATISVLLSAEQASQIDHYGRYGVTGTTFQVRGTYHQACSDDEGIPDIHATNSAVISRGIDHPDDFSWNMFFPGMIAVLIGGVLMGAFYIARERMR